MNLFNRIMPSNDMNTQVNADKASITLSLACMIHCLLMPSFLVLTSGFFALSIDNEFIHKAFLIIVLPVSLYALITGYRITRFFHIFIWVPQGCGFLSLQFFLERACLESLLKSL